MIDAIPFTFTILFLFYLMIAMISVDIFFEESPDSNEVEIFTKGLFWPVVLPYNFIKNKIHEHRH